MLITRTSPLSGEVVIRDIAVTQEQLLRWQKGEMIQDAMPNISPDEREFILTGITPEEWRVLLLDSDE